MALTQPKIDRRHQPQCATCSHSKSFHGGGKTQCRALGCKCKGMTPMATDPNYFVAIVALLLAGDVQARTVSNDDYTGVEVRLEDGGRVIWTQDIGAWVASAISAEGEVTSIRTGVPHDTPEQAAALIAGYEYSAPLLKEE